MLSLKRTSPMAAIRIRAAHALAGALVTALCCIGAPRLATASEVVNTTVEKVGVGPYFDSLCGFKCMLIAFAAAPAGSTCAMDTGWHYALDISTEEGRVAVATVLSAKVAGFAVQGNGNGTCIYSNRIERCSHLVGY